MLRVGMVVCARSGLPGCVGRDAASGAGFERARLAVEAAEEDGAGWLAREAVDGGEVFGLAGTSGFLSALAGVRRAAMRRDSRARAWASRRAFSAWMGSG